jgi:glycosyltransferase involved in cell wall biosynthesis
VLITAHNVADWITVAVKSAQDQLGPDDEIVVVDDASTDATSVLLANVEDRTVVVQNTSQLGSSASRNRAASIASGEVFVFLDGDDVALPGRIEMHRSAAAEGVDVSYGRIALIDEAGYLTGWHRETARRSRVPLRRQLTYENPIPFSASAVRADAFRAIRGFSEDVPWSEDWEFWARLAWIGRARFEAIEEHLTAYRIRRGSKSLDWQAQSQAYEAVRKRITTMTGTGNDKFATAAFERRKLLSTTLNAARRFQLEPRFTTARAIGQTATRAVVAEGRYRYRLLQSIRDAGTN